MSITQTVEIPADHRLTIDVPREVPTGPVILTFTPKSNQGFVEPEVRDKPVSEPVKERVFGCAKGQFKMADDFDAPLEDIRRLLQKEMAEQGTSAVIAAAGDGWEAHVRERYAQS